MLTLQKRDKTFAQYNKFTKDGIVTFGCELKDHKLMFSVKDTGIGISPQHIQELFQPYKQADVKTARQYGGTGLGLAISKKLTHLLNGEIGCQSEVGKGSTFYFHVPFVSGTIPERSPGQQKLQLLGHVLVVDDNEINRKVAARLLRNDFNLKVTCATNGTEVLHLHENERFDCILMDTEMAEMDGLEATRRLRALGITTPILSFTASPMPGEKERCKEAGMDGFVSKPIVRAELLEELVRFLNRK